MIDYFIYTIGIAWIILMLHSVGFFDLSQLAICLLDIKLIMGNHDILKKEWYTTASVKVYKNEPYISGPFAFIHDEKHMQKYPACCDKYFFTGHIHPGIFIRGTGKQSLHFSCFYFRIKNIPILAIDISCFRFIILK